MHPGVSAKALDKSCLMVPRTLNTLAERAMAKALASLAELPRRE